MKKLILIVLLVVVCLSAHGKDWAQLWNSNDFDGKGRILVGITHGLDLAMEYSLSMGDTEAAAFYNWMVMTIADQLPEIIDFLDSAYEREEFREYDYSEMLAVYFVGYLERASFLNKILQPEQS